MDLEKQLLPAHITVGGQLYKVKTDFRFGLMFARFLKERRAAAEYAIFFDGDAPPIDREACDGLVEFYSSHPALPRSMGDEGEALTDWQQDAELIFAAFWEVYGIDLFEVRLHWHKFLALFRSLRGTKLNDVIQIRAWKSTKATKAQHDAQMRKLKAAWQLEAQDTREADPAYQKFVAKLKPKKARSRAKTEGSEHGGRQHNN